MVLYFGVSTAVWGLFGFDWDRRPEPNLLPSLVESAVALIRPFLAVWFIAVPIIIVIAVPLALPDIARDAWTTLKGLWAFITRRKRNRDDGDD